eukprot:CAMPEP_0114410134 /NCGR_PEP_ID=MMETSP0102-20121206/23857_1 /TAXON_ID=38822 ORGANISM="Pteridomonas danica, Strain PT" /NCGR_SAMPLE_ID=MMETSP0102 /ASSEMBLY_ACC=CAM_ASM_000212 /LENGTH=98 /DNA_ID=CAMNT_0001577735 /DNA_START=656 /DNA_END=953 /DNA_ORIENTATION=+
MNVMGNTFYIVIEGIVIGSKSELIYGIGEESSCRSMSQGDMSLGSSSSFRNSADAGEKKEKKKKKQKNKKKKQKNKKKKQKNKKNKKKNMKLNRGDGR